MSLEIIRNDITKVHADAIVNAANPLVAIGRGVDTAIYNAAGKYELLEERKKIGVMRQGDVAITPAFNLYAKYIIHTIGPIWQGGNCGEVEIVAQCYRKSLEKAKELGLESIAFPLLASGTYGFPKDIALKTAITEISDFLFKNDMIVYLVVYDKESFEVSSKAFNDITEYISEKDIKDSNISFDYISNKTGIIEKIFSLYNKPNESYEDLDIQEDGDFYPIDGLVVDSALPDTDIDNIIKHKEQTFQEYLFRLIDKKGLEDIEVYKKANIDRKHFSKIRSNPNYNPSKRTALALAIALELNLDETKDLLLRAGIALSKSNTFDIIIEYCIEHHITDIYEINCILFKYDQPMLGA